MNNKLINEIILSNSGNTICGPRAHELYRITKVFKVLKLTTCEKYFVFDTDGTLRAAQSSKENALTYMNENRVLVYKEE